MGVASAMSASLAIENAVGDSWSMASFPVDTGEFCAEAKGINQS